MKKVWAMVLAVSLLAVPMMALAADDVLNVYNWGEYIDKQVITNFEKEYKVRVNYDVYDSNETMYTKLMSGASYDVIIPSDYMIERLIREKKLSPSITASSTTWTTWPKACAAISSTTRTIPTACLTCGRPWASCTTPRRSTPKQWKRRAGTPS